MFEEALALWKQTAVGYPFYWLAYAPWAALCAVRGDFTAAGELLGRVITPDQQLLPPDLTNAISKAATSSAADDIRAALQQAETYGLL